MKLVIVVRKGEDGYFVASCPALRGCHSQGETRAEAVRNIREAIQGCLEALNERARRSAGAEVREVRI